MTKTFVFLLATASLLLFKSTEAHAQIEASCWGHETALNVTVSIRQSVTIPYLFMSDNEGGPFPVAQLTAAVEGESISFFTSVDASQPELGNPVNIYAIMVLAEGQVLRYEDYTSGCRNPGISFFPSQKVHLFDLKNRPRDQMQIIIWARR